MAASSAQLITTGDRLLLYENKCSFVLGLLMTFATF